MPAINANIVVEPIELNVTQTTSQIGVTVEPVNLNVFTTAPQATDPGGLSGELQFNDSGSFGGLANATVASGTLTFSNLANLSIDGGVNGYVLQTDGTGVLSWTAQTGGGGTGSPGGANSQIQYNDNGVFGGYPGFILDDLTGDVSIPGNTTVVSNITSTSGAFFGDGYGLSNIVLGNIPAAGNIATVNLDGNVSNVLRGDGTFSGIPSNVDWDSVANISLGDIFVGKTTPVTIVVQPGANVEILPGADPTNFLPIVQNMSGGILNLSALSDGNLWCSPVSGQNVGTSADGNVWVAYSTGINPTEAPREGTTNLVVFDQSTSDAAYSTDFGQTWTTSTLPNSGLWQDLAFGDGSFVMCTSQAGYNRSAYSTDDGVTWGSSPMPGALNPSWVKIAAQGGGSNEFVCLDATGGTAVTSDKGVTWSAGNSTGASNGRDLVFADGNYVALYDQGISYRIPSSSVWTQVSFGSGNYQTLIYASPYWIAFDGGSDTIQYATTPAGPWTADNTNSVGGIGAFGAAATTNGLTFASLQSFNTNAVRSLVTNIQVTSSDGDYANAQNVPSGRYRALGAPAGGIGALWTKLS
jgi:hypothetical protein